MPSTPDKDPLTPRTLIAALNHASDSLGLYCAELARILGLRCDDVSDSRALEKQLQYEAPVQECAQRLVHLYTLLETRFDDDNVAMVHWLRVEHSGIGTTPLLAMVDEGRLEDVVAASIQAQDVTKLSRKLGI